MGQEKTESATPKRREKARKEGQVEKSQDMDRAIVLAVSLALFFAFAPSMLNHLKTYMYQILTHLNPSEIAVENFIGIINQCLHIIFTILAPFCLLLFLAVILIIGIQMKGLFTLDTIKPKLDKFSPEKLLKKLVDTFNIFKPAKFVELAKSLAKLVVLSTFSWIVVVKRKQDILNLLGADVETFFRVLASVLSEIIINICIAMLVIGILDRIFQHHQYEKNLKMTKQEIKDERKNSEGDPMIKGKIKSIQMQMAQSRMMGKVPTADVIVANPTHYAVALKYDTSIAPAPLVVAKGVDFVAFKIREVAENNGITIVENPPLARTLYKLVPIDAIIPAELFTAVAEVLAFVYRKRHG